MSIVGLSELGQTIVSELPPPASAPAPVTSVPVLVDAPFPVLRAARPSYPEPTAMGAQCFPVPGSCFTSQYTKDEAKDLCASGTRPQRIAGKGCPIGSPRIDSYGSYAETSASQFDPCRIKDFPVCSGEERFGDPSRFTQPMQVDPGGGIFSMQGSPAPVCRSPWDKVLGLAIDSAIIASVVGGPIIGYRQAKMKGAVIGAAAGVGFALPLLMVSLSRSFNGKFVILDSDCEGAG